MEAWVKFFRDAGIPNGPASTYAMKFCDHRIKKDMLADLDKGILHDMGISVMGDVIAILKHAKAVHAMNEREKLESDYIGQFKVAGLVSSQMDNVNQPAHVVPKRLPAPKPTVPPKPAPDTDRPPPKPLPAAPQPGKMKKQEIVPTKPNQPGTKRKSSDNLKEAALKASEVSTSQKSTPARVDSTTSVQSSSVKTVTVTKKSLSERFSSLPGSSKFSDPLKNKDTEFTIRLNTAAIGGVSESAVPQKKAKLTQNTATKPAPKASTQSPTAQKQRQAAALVSKAAKSNSQKKSVFDRLGEEHKDKVKEKPLTSTATLREPGKKIVKTAKTTETETKFKSLKPLKKVTVVKNNSEEKEPAPGSVFSRLGAGPEIPQRPGTSEKKRAVSPPLWEDDEDDYVIDYASHSVLQPAKSQSAARSRASTSKPVKPVKPLQRLSPDERAPSSSVFRRLGNKV